ncbi:MAG: hypothetical protein JZU63_03635, partial [Rhodoferax sp.]|nr:hypothetical protein [Rhodoferax sp.]
MVTDFRDPPPKMIPPPVVVRETMAVRTRSRYSRSTMPIARNDATNDEQNHQFLTLTNVVGTSPTSKKSFYRRPLRNHRVAATARKR